MPIMGRRGVAGALFTTTQQRVLGLLFAQPDQSLIQQEIIDRTGSGSGAVQRELARLVEAGLVVVKHIGRQKHYAVNRSAPIFEELRRIIRKTVGLADPLLAALRPLAKRIDLAIVHGSVARGEEHASSDVDLLIVADDLRLEQLFRRLVPVEKQLGRKINPTLYSRAEFAVRRRTNNPFVKKVLAGRYILLMGSIDAVEPR